MSKAIREDSPNEHARIDTRRQALGFVVILSICMATMAVGAAITNVSVNNWYTTLARPTWAPPDWVFGPVWTMLFLMMSLSAWLVWRREGIVVARWPLTLFATQLALNVGWSWLFFGLQSPAAALVEILILCTAVLATIISFWQRSVAAGLLLVPYFAWVTFAAALNYAYWQMNA